MANDRTTTTEETYNLIMTHRSIDAKIFHFQLVKTTGPYR